MVQTCCAMWCTNSHLSQYSTHSFPNARKRPGLRRQWVKFVCVKKANFADPPPGTILCGAHFTPESYSNYQQVKSGFAQKLLLKADAVPTIHAPPKYPEISRKRTMTGTDETTPPPQAKQRRGAARLEMARSHADVTVEDLHPEKHDPLHVKQEEESEMPCIKQEAAPETPDIKEEEQEDKIPKFPMCVSVKIEEDEGPSEESGAAKPSSDSSFQHLTTKGGGQSQTDGLLAPLSDSDDVTSHSSDTDTDEEENDFDQNASESFNNSLKKDTQECGMRKAFACTLCDKRFFQKTSLKNHQHTHTGEKPFACTLCDKRFYCKAYLELHQRTHSGKKPFPCSLCDKSFSWKHRLKKHIRTHNGEKPFGCTICGKRFTKKGSLVMHDRIHTGEKPFACSLCDKRFYTKSDLERHKRTHTGEKPFACSFCGKRFTQKGNLVLHERIHTGEKPFACSLCGKGFTQKGPLVLHTTKHTVEKPLNCNV
ncbi:zinc finger protein 391-like isoform X1 [Corythoichthys intestinalis]|uniref:zinc finger protein 391-like isoform X1 n=2 Tax=Corythoichthys intestinalis TaxID=161448 RepID=UPI0025A63200|nr:zinc finger protein 391-like isoform X1 [Corythoichthys intestinalis]